MFTSLVIMKFLDPEAYLLKHDKFVQDVVCPGLWAHIAMYYYKVYMIIWHPISLKFSFLIFIWVSNDKLS